MNGHQTEGIVSPGVSFSSTIALSVDVEDYFMSPECITVEDWPSFPSAIHTGMERMLALFERYQARATFFFLGWVAERYPELVQWTVERGHEIATHTYDHRFVSHLTESQFADSVRRSLEILRGLAPDSPITGHRAPAFSLDSGQAWQFEILRENGILYDSSINPHATYLYGDRCASRFPHDLHGLVEIPPGVVELGGFRLPVGGGGTLRILPAWYLRWARKRFQAEGGVPVVYIHPWEFVPGHPPIRLPWKLHAIHYTGLRTTERKIETLLRENRILTLEEYRLRWIEQKQEQKTASHFASKEI